MGSFNSPKKVVCPSYFRTSWTLIALQTGAFAGALLAFGLALYAVKQHIATKRKAELYEHRACT
jgi:hypothetical protein